MSKYAIAKRLIGTIVGEADTEAMDRHDVVEALMTLCIQDMLQHKGPDYTRDYLRYELDSVGAGGVFEIQKR